MTAFGKTALIAVGAAAVAIASPAIAATTITFSGATTSVGGSGSPAIGNSRAFGSGSTAGVATAFSYNGATLETSYVGDYTFGLGVTNQGEGNGSANNSHTIDNVGRYDIILFTFAQAVNLSSAALTAFAVSNDPLDNDAWVSYAPSANWTTLNANGKNVLWDGSSTSHSLGTAGTYSKVWAIGAARSAFSPVMDSNDDGFKLTSITVTAVPEPATWAMMIAGFGVAGVAVRRRRRADAAIALTA